MARGTGNPYYLQVYNELRQKITSGIIPEETYLPSERELGIHFKVDRVTIRKALAMLVESGMVEKRAGIGTFVKSSIVHDNMLNTSKNILFVASKPDSLTKNIDSVFLTEILINSERECRHQGYNLIYSRDITDSTLERLANGNAFKGILFVNSVASHILQESLDKKIPAVLINHSFDGLTCILPDNVGGVVQGIQYLNKNGHTRIATITGARGYYNAEQRLATFRQTLSSLNLPQYDNYILEGDWTYATAYACMDKLLKLPDPPTAVMAANDATAIGALNCILTNGLSVPEDISIIGFDNIENSAYTVPRLTTISVDLASIAQLACMHLFSCMDRGFNVDCRMIVPTHFVERESAGSVKKSSL